MFLAVSQLASRPPNPMEGAHRSSPQRCLGSTTSQQEMVGLYQLPKLGSSGALAAVSKLEQELGAMFFLVQCGAYAEGHPSAGQAALALIQLVLVKIAAPDSSQGLGQEPMGLVRVVQPPDCQDAALVVLAYELDQQQRLTGEHTATTHCQKLPASRCTARRTKQAAC